jgi:hypothetical protein
VTARNTDPTLWAMRPRFGVAGGPLAVTLTKEGETRAFAVGAQIKEGAADALADLWSIENEARYALFTTYKGGRIFPTAFGLKHPHLIWTYLVGLGLTEPIYADPANFLGNGVRLTELGKTRAQAGIEERARLLERCKKESEGAQHETDQTT